MTKQYGTPGPRAIYPEMCDSPSLGRCGLLANVLFPRLIAQADDQGRLPGGAREVLVQCVPHLSYVAVDEVDAALGELEAEGHLQRYAAEGRTLLQLVTWWRWQSSMRRAYPSRWPSPKGWQDLVYGVGTAGPQRLEEAIESSSPRNAAIRGRLPRIATSRDAPAHGGVRGPARGGPRARDARPDPTEEERRARPPEGGAARGGEPEPVREGLKDFLRKNGIPEPDIAGGTRR